MKKRDVRLNTESHREPFDAFADAMRSAEHREGWRSSETLRNFLDAGFRAVRGRLLTGKAFEENEAEYMRIVKSCRQPSETRTDLSRMLGALCSALQRDPIDFVGPIFTELSADAGMGQFFTPHHVSYLMAKMIVGDTAKEVLDGKPYITLCEPACGIGVMMLATNAVLRESGVDVATQAHWHMTDIDHRAVCAAYLQASFTDCSAVVVHGNTLSRDPAWSFTQTPAAFFYPKSFDDGAGRPPHMAAEIKSLPSSPVSTCNEPLGSQLTLF